MFIYLLIQHLCTWHVQILQIERKEVHESVSNYHFTGRELEDIKPTKNKDTECYYIEKER